MIPRAGKLKQAFTLVELLVVIGLMGAMLVVAIPAFRGLGEGSAMRSAVAQVRSTLSLARQYAITHNTTTRFIIPGPLGGSYDAATTKHCLSSYAVYDMKNKTYLQSWEELPAGIVFDYNLDHAEIQQTYPPGKGNVFASYVATTKLPYPTEKDLTKTRPMAWVQFRSDGRANFSANSPVGDFGAVVISEGSATWPESGTLDPSKADQFTMAGNDAEGLLAKRAIVVYRRTGRLEVKTF